MSADAVESLVTADNLASKLEQLHHILHWVSMHPAETWGPRTWAVLQQRLHLCVEFLVAEHMQATMPPRHASHRLSSQQLRAQGWTRAEVWADLAYSVQVTLAKANRRFELEVVECLMDDAEKHRWEAGMLFDGYERFRPGVLGANAEVEVEDDITAETRAWMEFMTIDADDSLSLHDCDRGDGPVMAGGPEQWLAQAAGNARQWEEQEVEIGEGSTSEEESGQWWEDERDGSRRSSESSEQEEEFVDMGEGVRLWAAPWEGIGKVPVLKIVDFDYLS